METYTDPELGSENDRTALLSTSSRRFDAVDDEEEDDEVGIAGEPAGMQAPSSSRRLLAAANPCRVASMAVLSGLAVSAAVTLSTSVVWPSPCATPSARKPLARADGSGMEKAWSIWPWQWFDRTEGGQTSSSSSSSSSPESGDSVEAQLDELSRQSKDDKDGDDDSDLDSLVASVGRDSYSSAGVGPTLSDTDPLVDQPTDRFPGEGAAAGSAMDPLDIYFSQLRGDSGSQVSHGRGSRASSSGTQVGQLPSWPGITYTLTSTTTTRPSRVVLYCFAVMKTGGYEEPLLREQIRNRVGIFECDYPAVLSDAVVYLAGPTPEDKVLTENIGDLTCKYGGPYNLALNSGIFAKAWQRVFSDAVYRNADWTIKADPDAVFLPARLRAMLREADPSSLTYLNNCDQGLHGPIEVISLGAMKVFGSRLTECVQTLSKEWSWAGEDVFLRHCLGYLKINRVDAFSILKEDHCFGKDPKRDGCFSSEVSFHPFKDRDSWFRCWGQAQDGGASVNTLVAKKRLLNSA